MRVVSPERAAYEKSYREQHKERQRIYMQAYYQANKDRYRDNARKYRKENREKVRAQGRMKARRRKGVKEPSAEIRTGTCPICLHDGPLVLDHDHATGHARGWICRACNCAIGHLGDCPEGITRALVYFQRTGGRDV